jgi:hypothetical protein
VTIVERPGQPTWQEVPILLSNSLTAHLQNLHNKYVEFRKTTRNWGLGICFQEKILCVGDRKVHVLTIWIMNILFPSMPFLLSKNGLCIWISAYPFMEIDFLGNPPLLWWIWNFAHMYITHIWTRIWALTTHIYIRKWFFWLPKHCCPSRAQWKKTFCFTLNVMISQTVRNECLRFGGHVGIQLSYKIL